MSAPIVPTLATIPSPTGSTRVFAVIGHPVEQVQAPMLMNRLFLDRGSDAVMVPLSVAPQDLLSVVRGLQSIANLDGILVTVPHKFAVCDLVGERSETVELAGSANALRRESNGRWSAENFDGTGFVAGLTRAGHDPTGKTVTLVGCGGAGASIAPALLLKGADHIALVDVSPARAQALSSRLLARWAGRVRVSEAVAEESQIVINATPLGLRPEDPLPFGVDRLSPAAIVADIIMKPAETRLLRAAGQRGLKTHPGIHMLTEQIELYRGFFRIP